MANLPSPLRGGAGGGGKPNLPAPHQEGGERPASPPPLTPPLKGEGNYPCNTFRTPGMGSFSTWLSTLNTMVARSAAS